MVNHPQVHTESFSEQLIDLFQQEAAGFILSFRRMTEDVYQIYLSDSMLARLNAHFISLIALLKDFKEVNQNHYWWPHDKKYSVYWQERRDYTIATIRYKKWQMTQLFVVEDLQL